MLCTQCGQQAPDNAAFCPNCGHAFPKPSQPTQPPVGSTPLSQPVPPQNKTAAFTPPIPPTQPQNKTANFTPPPTYSQTPPAQPEGSELISIGSYIIMFILMAIPIVNIVMLCIWSFGSSTLPNKKNFARAALIMMAISIVLGLILSIASGGLLALATNAIFY